MIHCRSRRREATILVIRLFSINPQKKHYTMAGMWIPSLRKLGLKDEKCLSGEGRHVERLYQAVV